MMKGATAIILALALSGAAASAEDIAISLVHGRQRIDIPVSALESIEAVATVTFVIKETNEKREFRLPHVEFCYTQEIGERICRLTSQIVEQPLDLVIDCETVSSPIVREPLCGQPCMQVSVNDISEGKALVQRLRGGSNRQCRPMM